MMRLFPVFFLVSCGTKSSDDGIAAATDSGAATTGQEGESEEVDCSDRSYTVPSTRGEVGGVWDTSRERFVFFGGDEGTPISCIPKPAFVDEVWAFYPDCDNFEALEVSGDPPHARSRHAVTNDPARGQMLVHGGRYRLEESGDYTLFEDLWAFDLANQAWSQLSEGDGPTPRRTHTMVVAGDTLLLYGGNTATSSVGYTPSQQLWGYDLVNGGWTGLDGAGAPGGRIFHAASVSDAGDTMYIYGGADENALFGPFFGDLWAYEVSSGNWTELHSGAESAPDARIWPNLLFDGTHNRLLLWAGHDDQSLGNTNQVWAFDLTDNTWTQSEAGDIYNAPANGFCDFPANFIDPDMDAPERRYAGAAALSESELFIFGGKTDCGQVNDLWTWDLGGTGWTERSNATFGEICARTFADPENCESLCF
jgi:hypothetical protein